MSTVVANQAALDAAMWRGDREIVIDSDPRRLLTLDVAVDVHRVRIRATGWSYIRVPHNTEVTASGRAVVDATDRARIHALDQAQVLADGQAVVDARGDASVSAAGRAKVFAACRGTVRALQGATVWAGGSTDVTLYGDATAWAWGDVAVRACGQSTANLAGHATLINQAPLATVTSRWVIPLWVAVPANTCTTHIDYATSVTWPERGLVDAPARLDGGYGLRLAVSPDLALEMGDGDKSRTVLACQASMDDCRIGWPTDGDRTPWIEARRVTVLGSDKAVA